MKEVETVDMRVNVRIEDLFEVPEHLNPETGDFLTYRDLVKRKELRGVKHGTQKNHRTRTCE